MLVYLINVSTEMYYEFLLTAHDLVNGFEIAPNADLNDQTAGLQYIFYDPEYQEYSQRYSDLTEGLSSISYDGYIFKQTMSWPKMTEQN